MKYLILFLSFAASSFAHAQIYQTDLRSTKWMVVSSTAIEKGTAVTECKNSDAWLNLFTKSRGDFPDMAFFTTYGRCLVFRDQVKMSPHQALLIEMDGWGQMFSALPATEAMAKRANAEGGFFQCHYKVNLDGSCVRKRPKF